MSSENEQPPGRNGGRHAAPRQTVRGRIQRPVGRAIALTAMPTALLMGTLGPKLAFAADGAPKVVPNSVPASAGTSGAACTKGAPGTGTGATTPAAAKTAGTAGAPGKAAGSAGAAKTVPHAASGNSSSSGANLPTQRGGATGSGSGSTGSGSASGGTTGGTTGGSTGGGGTGGGGTGGTTGGTGAGTPTPSASPTASDPLGGILGGLLGGILGGHAATNNSTGAHPATRQPSTTPSAAHAAGAHTAAVRDASTSAPSSTPTATASTPTASSTPTQAAPSPTQTTPSPSSTPSSSSSTGATNADPNKACDISHLAAPLDTSVTSQLPAGTMPVEKWTLRSSDLKLINSVFHGVVTVPLADGTTQRVLKFTAEAVNIGDLDMSANQRGQEVHVKGSPGSTSTMRGGTVTMYVTELKGTLLAAEGIPLSLLNVNLDLTPDTLPQWLYNLIGAIPIPLTLELGNVTAIQQGQFGGNLTIPGMHLYYTPLGQ